MTDGPTIQELWAMLQEQRQEIAELRKQLARAGGQEGSAAPIPPDSAAAIERRLSRAGLLRAAAAGVAGMAAAEFASGPQAVLADSNIGHFWSDKDGLPALTAQGRKVGTAQGQAGGEGLFATSDITFAVRAISLQTTAIYAASPQKPDRRIGPTIVASGRAGVAATGIDEGIRGTSDGGAGVTGHSSTGTGVAAHSDSGIAFIADSGFTLGASAYAYNSKNGWGMIGRSYGDAGQSKLGTGIGVEGNSGAGTGIKGTNQSVNGAPNMPPGSNTANAAILGRNVLNWPAGTVLGSGIGVQGEAGRGIGVRGLAGAGTGVYGRGVTGVWGESDAHDGVRGASNGGSGVFGLSGNTGSQGAMEAGVVGWAINSAGHGYGVIGRPMVAGSYTVGDGVGVLGESRDGIGVEGNATGGGSGITGVSATGRGGIFSGGAAQIQLQPSTATAPPASGQAGDLFLDATGRLSLCTAGGDNATWREIQLI